MNNPHHQSRQVGRLGCKGARSQIIPGHLPRQVGQARNLLRARWSAWYENTGPVWRFGLKFGALMALFYLTVLMPFFDRLLYAHLAESARFASAILNWLGQDTLVSEITVRSARFAITVRRGCDAVEPSWFLCAALVSFPAPYMRKVIGIMAGVALLQVLNLIRIVSLYFVGLHYPRYFGPAHLEVWPAVFVVAAIAFWIGWIAWARRPVQTPPYVGA